MPPVRAADASLAACPVRHWAQAAPGRIAIHGDISLTYRQLDTRLNGLCQQLTQAGLKPGDRLTAVVRGALEDALLAWACVRSGLVPGPACAAASSSARSIPPSPSSDRPSWRDNSRWSPAGRRERCHPAPGGGCNWSSRPRGSPPPSLCGWIPTGRAT